MQYKMFAVSALGDDAGEEQLNSYLRANRVLAVRKELVSIADRPVWCFCVETLAGAEALRPASGKKRVDYKEILSAEDFTLFVALRDLRKTMADAEAVPVFTIFTNEQLAEIARRRPTTVRELEAIDGIGAARSSKYGAAVTALVTERAGRPHEELAPAD